MFWSNRSTPPIDRLYSPTNLGLGTCMNFFSDWENLFTLETGSTLKQLDATVTAELSLHLTIITPSSLDITLS